jgi:hypothetical protein
MRGLNPADVLRRKPEEQVFKDELGLSDPTFGKDVYSDNEASLSEEYTDAIVASKPEEAPISVEEPEQVMDASEPQVQAQPEPELSREEKLIKELRRIQDEKTSEAKTAQEEANKRALWANAIQTLGTVGQAQIQRDAGVQTGMSSPKMIQAEDARGRVMSERDAMLKQMMDEYKMLQGATPNQMSELDRAKIESEKARAEKFRADAQKAQLSENKDSFQDKEKIKEEVKIRTENRKERKNIEKDMSATEKLVKDLEEAKREFEKYSKNKIGGTGPIATLFGLTKYLSEDTEKLDSLFKQQNLETMTKLFAGMSKAVDSDAERRAFEAAQPSVANDDETNRSIFERRIKAAKDLLKKQKSSYQSIDKEGNIKEESSTAQGESSGPYGNKVTRNGKNYIWNSSVNKYLLDE